MLTAIIYIVSIFITILFIIGTHEAAHFLAARMLGVKVLRFSIGFGKTLWHRFDKSGTEYVFALIPLGGYVKMLDENEGHVPAKEVHLTYNRQPFWKKCIIILAGPGMNILCAFLLYWLVFSIGFVTVRPVTGPIEPKSIAAIAGVTPKQEIVTVDNEGVENWTGIVFRLIAHAGDKDFLSLGTQSLDGAKKQTHQLDLSNWHFDPLTPDLLGSIGIIPYVPDIPLIIGQIGAASPAATSKLQMGDKIIAIQNKKVKNWEEIVTTINKEPGNTLNFTIERKNHRYTIPVEVGTKHTWLGKKYGYLGVGPHFEWPKELLKTVKYGPADAAKHAWYQIYDMSYFNVLLFGKMLTGKLSLKSLGGPITIFETSGEALNSGFLVYISFLAFLSISIGVVNLFPIPGLDGGHILIHSIEVIKGKALSERVLNIVFKCGLILILFVIIQALINDLLRLG